MFKRKKEEPLVEEETIVNVEEVSDAAAGMDIPEEEKTVKKKLPGWVIIPVILVLLVIAIVVPKAAQSGKKTADFNVVKVEKGDVKQVYNTSGTIESEKKKTFYSPVNAPIATCTAKVGQSVKAGDILVTYDTKDLEKNNQESQLNALATQYTNQAAVEESSRAAKTQAETKAQAAAGIQDLQNQVNAKQAEINQLESQMGNASNEAAANAAKAAALQPKLQAKQNEVAEYNAVISKNENDLTNFAVAFPEIKDEDAIKAKKSELEDAIKKAKADRQKAQAEYDSLDAQLKAIGPTDASGYGEALAAAQQELSALKSSLSELERSNSVTTDTGLTGGQMRGMQVSENLNELALLTTEELVAKGKEGIKAEFDGVISDVKALEGSDAVQGGELFTIVGNQDVYVQLEVSANDFDNLKLDSKAAIKIGNSKYKGTVTEIDKIAIANEKGTPVIGAQVHIDNPDDGIYIGVSAKVELTVDEKKSVLCLPNEVVNTSSSGDFVYIIENGVVKKQMVELGVASSTKVEITKGLKKGQQVVSDTTGTIKEGMKASATMSNTAE